MRHISMRLDSDSEAQPNQNSLDSETRSYQGKDKPEDKTASIQTDRLNMDRRVLDMIISTYQHYNLERGSLLLSEDTKLRRSTAASMMLSHGW